MLGKFDSFVCCFRTSHALPPPERGLTFCGASPGRFFSTHELKLFFAHIVLNYDFKFFDERPKSKYLSDFCVWEDHVYFETCRRERSAHLDLEASS